LGNGQQHDSQDCCTRPASDSSRTASIVVAHHAIFHAESTLADTCIQRPRG
jgi:hypothetical protein